MTEDRKNLIIEKYKEYENIVATILSNTESFEASEHYRGKRLEFIKLLIELDTKLGEPIKEVEVKEEKPTTKKK